MLTNVAFLPSKDDTLANLLADGGRRVMYGGDPYEDDLERPADSQDLPNRPEPPALEPTFTLSAN